MSNLVICRLIGAMTGLVHIEVKPFRLMKPIRRMGQLVEGGRCLGWDIQDFGIQEFLLPSDSRPRWLGSLRVDFDHHRVPRLDFCDPGIVCQSTSHKSRRFQD